MVGTDGLHLAVLEEPEEQRLHAEAHLAHFVQEQRAAVRELQLAGLVTVGAGEAALHVAEQLRFEKRLREAGAVDRDERTRSARGAHVDLSRDEILAHPALTGDEHLRVTRRHPLDERQDVRHLLAGAHDYGRRGRGGVKATDGNGSQHLATHEMASALLA